jgi:hypothetical protein
MVGKLVVVVVVVVVVAADHPSPRGPSRLSRWLVMISAYRLPLGMPAYRLRSEKVSPIQHPVTATAAATAATTTIIIITTAATATTRATATTTSAAAATTIMGNVVLGVAAVT